jgi:membrane protease YdiL (CAAX protease family)
MEQKRKNAVFIIALVLLSCVVMAVIETVIEPAYAIKSAWKVVFFLILPLILLLTQKTQTLQKAFTLHKKSVPKLLGLGLLIYAVIMGAYFLTKGVFDYNALVSSLSADQQVSPENFFWVAGYISFGNSLLEEFLFRLVGLLALSVYLSKKAAYLFSSLLFALYHVAMIGGSFPIPLLLLSLLGLTVGGLIFDYVDEKDGTIYHSWFIHMFADFAIMTIWYFHIV